MNSKAVSSIVLLSVLASPGAFASPYASSRIHDYCRYKSYLPFTESLDECIDGVKNNALSYQETLQQVREAAGSFSQSKADLQQLHAKIKDQLTFLGIDLSRRLGADDLLMSLKRAYTAAQSTNREQLDQWVEDALTKLRAIEKSL